MFKTIWTDDDGMLQVEVVAANSATVATMEAFTYSIWASRSPSALEQFPTHAAHEVMLESGSPIRVGGTGTCVCASMLRMALDTLSLRSSWIVAAIHRLGRRIISHFRCNPADMNELGRQLNQWADQPSQELRGSGVTPNNRFERSRGRVFGEPRSGSMIWINQLRWSSAQPRVAQPHR